MSDSRKGPWTWGWDDALDSYVVFDNAGAKIAATTRTKAGYETALAIVNLRAEVAALTEQRDRLADAVRDLLDVAIVADCYSGSIDVAFAALASLDTDNTGGAE